MEADWAVEVGSDLPRIDSEWSGWVNLRERPEAVSSIPEASQHPALHDALVLLNSSGSSVFTSKCDVWPLALEEIDPLEFDAAAKENLYGIACYIDVVQRLPERFSSFALHETWVQKAAARLRETPVRNGRADLVIRGATRQESDGFGLTLYAAGCGGDTPTAETAWGAILAATATVTMRMAEAFAALKVPPAGSIARPTDPLSGE